MKTSCLQENLSRALATVGRAVATRATLPVTQNVLFATDDNGIQLSATNLEMAITTRIPAMIEEPGAVTIPARLLTEFINSLSSDRVDLNMEPGSTQVNISSGQSRANINGTHPGDFPPIPEIEEAMHLYIDPATMRHAISRTAFAAASEESRPVLTGVEFKLNEGRFSLTAADGFRLAIQQADLSSPVDEPISLIIPAKSMSEINRLLGEQSDSLRVAIPEDRRYIMFQAQGKDQVTLTTQLLQGTFPNTEQLIPQDHTTRAVIDAATALRAVRTAAIFARDGSNIIRLEMTAPDHAGEGPDAPTITVSARSEEIGDEEEPLGLLDIEGDSSKIAFNSRYLIDILSVLDKGNIAIETNSSSSPGVFRPTDSDDYVHVIMPMFVQW